MNTSVKINHIIEQIAELDDHTKKLLMDEILQMINKNTEKRRRNLTDLKGLGKELWKNINVENYIQTERQWD
jgi:hypothetical protein